MRIGDMRIRSELVTMVFVLAIVMASIVPTMLKSSVLRGGQ